MTETPERVSIEKTPQELARLDGDVAGDIERRFAEQTEQFSPVLVVPRSRAHEQFEQEDQYYRLRDVASEDYERPVIQSH